MDTIFSRTQTTGYRISITSLLGIILKDAEIKYGARDTSYTILGIQFTSDDGPSILYPNHSRSIIIQITNNCIQDMNRAVFQVAHEVIHCLFPSGEQKASYLEEGLATYHSISFTKNNGYGVWFAGHQKYQSAFDAFIKILEIDSDIIRKIRLIQPSISLVAKDQLLEINPNIPEDLAELLTTQFYQN
jgi:hypothetical protein